MTSGNTFWTDIAVAQREHFKRRLWPFALTVLVYFLYYVVALSLVLTSYVTDSGGIALAERKDRMMEAAAGMIGPNVYIVVATLAVAAVLSLQGFSWMHSRRTVDFYESHPVGRSRRFAQVCVNSFIIFLVSYAASLIIGILICRGFGIYGGEITRAVFEGSIKAFALFFSTYFIGVLAATLTGNVLISVLAMGVLMGYEALLLIVVDFYTDAFLTTVVDDGYSMYFSPIYYYVMDGIWKPVAAMLLLGLGCAAAAFFCYHIRKNEAAGRAVVFRPVQTVVKIAISVIGGLVAWIVFKSSGSTVLSLAFMCFFIVVVGCIIQIIYDADFKALFRHGWELAVAAAISLAVILGMKYDVMGYDRWMPEPEAVKDAAVHFTSNNWAYIVDEKGFVQGSREYAFKNMNIKDTEAVIELARKGLEHTMGGAVTEEGDVEYTGGTTEYLVEYNMKSGRQVKRRYWLPYELYPELMERVTSEEGFRQGIFQVYHDEYIREHAFEFEVWYDNGQETKNPDGRQLSPDFYEKFREAYLADLPQYSYKLDRGELPVGSLVLHDTNRYNEVYYPVYECFGNTINVLKEAGCYLEKIDMSALAAELKEKIDKYYAEASGADTDISEEFYIYDRPEDYEWYLFNNCFGNSQAIRGLFRSIEDEMRELGVDYYN
jgi:hypothetical protein